jgi:excisionase family DNA binding protein
VIADGAAHVAVAATVAGVRLVHVSSDAGRCTTGVRWHTGATDEILTTRPLPPGPASRTPAAAVELIQRLGPTTNNDDLVTELNAARLRTGHGRRFDIDAVQWIRHLHKIPVPSPYLEGELSVTDTARRLQVSTGTVYYWIKNGHLTARRGRRNRLGIPWTSDVEAACRRRIAESLHLNHPTQHVPAGAAV